MSPTKFYSQRKAAMKRMNSRHRPLHASGVSIIAMVHIAYRKTLDFHGPLGSSWRRMAKLAESADPLIYAIQYQLLAILSFLDDHVMVFEKMIEKLFPPSSFVFDKIDDLVLVIMSLPEKFDHAMNKFPAIIHQVPFMEGVLVHLISGLNSLIFTLNHWGLENKRIKEVTMDIKTICSEKLEPPNLPIDSSEKSNTESKESFPLTSESETSEAESMRVAMAVWTQKRGSYKEALEKGKEENSQKRKKKFQSPKSVKKEKEKEKDREDESMNVKMEKKFWRQKIVKKEKDKEDGSVHVKNEVGRSGGIKEEDPLLGLFESGWNMKHEREVDPVNFLRN